MEFLIKNWDKSDIEAVLDVYRSVYPDFDEKWCIIQEAYKDQFRELGKKHGVTIFQEDSNDNNQSPSEEGTQEIESQESWLPEIDLPLVAEKTPELKPLTTESHMKLISNMIARYENVPDDHPFAKWIAEKELHSQLSFFLRDAWDMILSLFEMRANNDLSMAIPSVWIESLRRLNGLLPQKLWWSLETKLWLFHAFSYFMVWNDLNEKDFPKREEVINNLINLYRYTKLSWATELHTVFWNSEQRTILFEEMKLYVQEEDMKEKSYHEWLFEDVEEGNKRLEDLKKQWVKELLSQLEGQFSEEMDLADSEKVKKSTIQTFKYILTDSFRYRITRWWMDVSLAELKWLDKADEWQNSEYFIRILALVTIDYFNNSLHLIAEWASYANTSMQEMTKQIYDPEKEYNPKDDLEAESLIHRWQYKWVIDAFGDFTESLIELWITPHVAIPDLADDILKTIKTVNMEMVQEIMNVMNVPEWKWSYFYGYLVTMSVLIVVVPMFSAHRLMTLYKSKFWKNFGRVLELSQDEKAVSLVKRTSEKVVKAEQVATEESVLKASLKKGNDLKNKTVRPVDDAEDVTWKVIQKTMELTEKLKKLKAVSKQNRNINTALRDEQIFSWLKTGGVQERSIQESLLKKANFTPDEIREYGLLDKQRLTESRLKMEAVVAMKESSEMLVKEYNSIASILFVRIISWNSIDDVLRKFDSSVRDRLIILIEQENME